MNFALSAAITELPIFNKIAIVVINFTVFALLLTVFNHSRFKDVFSRIFVFMGGLMLAWVNFAYLARLAGKNSIELSELFLRIAWVATPLLFYLTYLTSIYVIKKEKNYKIISTILLVLALLLSAATAFTNLVIKGIAFTGANLDIVYGVGFYPFLSIIFLFMVSTIAPLLKKKLTQSSKVFLIGVIIFYVANVIFNISLPLFTRVTHLYYIGDYSTVFLLGFTAYAIVRHELFNIKIVATEALTVLIWIILFAKLFVTQSPTEAIIDSVILSLVVIFGILLIRSVINEVRHGERLQELSNKLRELDRQKDEFISMAAHELRGPSTAIKGYLSMVLEGDAGEIPVKARNFLSDASAVNDRLIRLVNNMLNVSRIEKGKLVYQMEEVDLIKVIQEAFYSFRFEAERKGLEFTLNIPDGIKDRVYADPDRVSEVIGNLASNAVKFTEEGSISINLSQPAKDHIRCEVVDTGPGISAEEQKKLFRKFYRAESTEGKTIGTGLGLYISKLLIEKFEGEIGIESKFGKGSTFWFELPLAKKVA